MRAYRKVCGFNSKPVKVEGLIKYLKVSLARNHNISLLMDVVFMYILDVWGILLSRKWGPLLEVMSKWTCHVLLSHKLMEPVLSSIGSLPTLLM